MKNVLGVEVPQYIEGLGQLHIFDGKRYSGTIFQQELKAPKGRSGKIVASIEKVVELCGLKDGMTISFHHHFRNGDYIVNMVMDTLAKMGFKDLVVAASSLTSCHHPMIDHIKNGVVKRIETSGMRGELANAVSDGLMDLPVIFRSHGGRAYAIASGELKIDVAFLGAPSCDRAGNANGYNKNGDTLYDCGSLGYAMVDAQHASKTVILTNNIVPYPNTPCAIKEVDVDYIVKMDAIGDPKGIASGATRFTTNPRELKIARTAADIMENSGYFNDGFSFQTGTGGASLAVTRFLRDKMVNKKITASFALGGITGAIVKLHEEGLVKKLLDVQGFDLEAARSVRENPSHCVISGHHYAGSGLEGAAVDQLDMVVLSALEIDTDFNVNVLTGSDGVIRGAIGGHPDTASGAKMTIVVAPLIRGRIPTILDRVNTIVTPGATVDVFVTEYGVAVNPMRQDLIHNFTSAGMQLSTIEEFQKIAEGIVGKPKRVEYGSKIVGLVYYRDSSVIDVIRQV
ncbi:citrate lyase subunit alpha [Petroclostridium sp. X23]|uniref:citrate lyase subunit alpha n=1 Tax=Petroclostridium sp. X23 TaxID=3045146 RepID=UPI0024AE1260|nr:citrate lyase subunit alpha [Petroclostridium sp. X23]WHH61674.1 citrate lyase subunit alpha [Petroclostridium sp. X23]